MPFMPGSAFGQLAKANFTAKGIQVPVKWSKPEGNIAEGVPGAIEAIQAATPEQLGAAANAASTGSGGTG